MAKQAAVVARALGLAVAGLLVTLSGSSRATVVSDGSSFSIDLSNARVCIVEPAALKSDVDCAGVDVSRAVQPPIPDGGTLIAHGFVLGPGDASHARLLGVLSVVRVPAKRDRPLTAEEANRLIEAMASEIGPKLPSGARVMQTSSHLVTDGEATVGRGALTLVGLPPEKADAAGHIELAYVETAAAMYVINCGGPSKYRAALSHFVDMASSTVKVSVAVRAKPALVPDPPSDFPRLSILAFLGIALALMGWSARRFRAHRAAYALQREDKDEPPQS